MNDEAPTVETRLAVLGVKLDQLIEMNQTRGVDHENRIRKLEERKFPLPTIAALFSAAAIVLTVLQYVKFS